LFFSSRLRVGKFMKLPEFFPDSNTLGGCRPRRVEEENIHVGR
jgi:hypothetical protein